MWGLGYGNSSLAGFTSDQLLSLYGVSGSSVGDMLSSQNSYSQSAGMSGLGNLGAFGFGMGGMGSYYGTSTNGLSMLLGTATADDGGDTVSLNKESFASLVEILRIQMLMNASKSAGSVIV